MYSIKPTICFNGMHHTALNEAETSKTTPLLDLTLPMISTDDKHPDALSELQSPNEREVHRQNASPLTRLPAELRNKIYIELLCPDSVSLKSLAKGDKSSKHSSVPPTSLHPSILSTCRLINSEAGPLLYSHNIFHAHPSLLTSLPHFSTSSCPVLHPMPLSLIKRWTISLRLDIDPRFTAEQARVAFSGAEFFEIRVWQAQFEACDLSVLKLFLGVRAVGSCRVLGLEREGLAGWLEGVMMSKDGEGEADGRIDWEKDVLGEKLAFWKYGGR